MIDILQFLTWVVATGAASIGGFTVARRFVRDRLRYVDAAHKSTTPWLAAGATVVAAAPVVWILPVVGAGTAFLVGASVGLGVKKGSTDTRGNGREVMVL